MVLPSMFGDQSMETPYFSIFPHDFPMIFSIYMGFSMVLTIHFWGKPHIFPSFSPEIFPPFFSPPAVVPPHREAQRSAHAAELRSGWSLGESWETFRTEDFHGDAFILWLIYWLIYGEYMDNLWIIYG